MTFLTWPYQTGWLTNQRGAVPTEIPAAWSFGVALGLSFGVLLALSVWLFLRWQQRRERRRMLARLRDRLASEYADHAEAIFATDLDGCLVYLNEAAEQLAGWSETLAHGQRLSTVLPLSQRDGTPVDALSVACRPAASGPAFAPLSTAAPDPAAGVAVPLPLLRIPGRPNQTLSMTLLPLRLGDLPRARDGRSDGRRDNASFAPADRFDPWVGMMLTVSDGTTQRRTVERDALTLRINHATVDAVIGITGAFKIASWNAGASSMLSYEDVDVLGEPLAMLVMPDRLPALEQAARAAFAGELLHDRDLVVRARDGRECDVSLAAFPLPPSEHSDVEMVLVLRDIHDRRQGERRVRHLSSQLVRRAQELQAIFDIAPVGLAIADSPDCRHVRPNVALARLFGLDRATDIRLDGGASDARYAIWHDGRPMQAAESPLLASVSRRAAIEPMELEIRMADRTSTVMAYSAPVIDYENAVVGAIGVFVDISAMKHVHSERQRLLSEAIAARRVAEEASRLKEEFLATVSHELRTPLNAMHGWLEIMQRKPDAQTQARGMDVIRRNVKAQTRVIEDILDVSAFVTGKARLIVQPIDLLDVARATVESLRPTSDAKAVKLLMSDAVRAPVNGDPERLQQIIWNLLSNAIKFTPSGGTVSLRLRREGEGEGGSRAAEDETIAIAATQTATVSAAAPPIVAANDDLIHQSRVPVDDAPIGTALIEVSDNGEGIDAAFLPYVFDRFRQADASIERRHSGLGLGLSIVRHLTELHGGTVQVDSAGLGRGATFRIRLPLRAAGEAAIDAALPVGPDGSAASAHRGGTPRVFGTLLGKRILLVEDDVSAADMLAHALDDDGALVRVAHSAEEGLQRLADFADGYPDVVVSDIGMPQRDGYSFVADIRAADRQQGREPILCVAVTAYARPEDRERALAAGFDAYLVKPVTPSALSELIARRLGTGLSPSMDHSGVKVVSATQRDSGSGAETSV